MSSAIVCEGLTKHFGSVRAVEDLSFRVEPGEVVGFLGPNGAGKTTTIRMLLDLIRPTRGRVEVLGKDPRKGSVALRRRIGYLPGDLAMYGGLTGRQLLEFVAALRGTPNLGPAQALAERLSVALDRPIARCPGATGRRSEWCKRWPMNRSCSRIASRSCAPGGWSRSSRCASSNPRRCASSRSDSVGRYLPRLSPTSPASAPSNIDGDLLRASVVGSVDALVKAASRFTVESISGHEADLEDAFLAYYTDATDAPS